MNTAFGLILPQFWFIAPQFTDGAKAFCREKEIITKERTDLAEMVMQALKNGMKPDELLSADPTAQS